MEEESFVIETNNEDDWDIVCPEDWEEKLDSEFDIVNFEDLEEPITEDLPGVKEKTHNISIDQDKFEDLECEIINESNLLISEVLGDEYLDNEDQQEIKQLKKCNSKNENIVFNEDYFAEDQEGKPEDVNESIQEDENQSEDFGEFDADEEEDLKMLEVDYEAIARKHEIHEKLIKSDLFWEKYDEWDSRPNIQSTQKKFKTFKRLQRYKSKRDGWKGNKIRFLFT